MVKKYAGRYSRFLRPISIVIDLIVQGITFDQVVINAESLPNKISWVESRTKQTLVSSVGLL